MQVFYVGLKEFEEATRRCSLRIWTCRMGMRLTVFVWRALLVEKNFLEKHFLPVALLTFPAL